VKDAPGEPKFSAQDPVLLTSAGQSADVQMVKVLLERNKIANKMNQQSGVEALSGAKSVIIIIDGSAKGWERPAFYLGGGRRIGKIGRRAESHPPDSRNRPGRPHP